MRAPRAASNGRPVGGRVRPADRYVQVGHAVAELNAAVRDGQDHVELLRRICAQVRRLTGAVTVTAMTVDLDGALVVRAVVGQAIGWSSGRRVPVDETLAGNALLRRRPVTATLRRSRYRHEQALAAAGLHRVLYLPIPGYGSVAGVLGAGFRRTGLHSASRRGDGVCARDVRLLEPLAAVAGLVEPLRALVEQTAAAERDWLARELHDSVMQALYAISLGAGTASELVRRGQPDRAQESIAWIQKTSVAGLTDLRGLILRLLPDTLAGNGLTAALTRLLETLHVPQGGRTVAELGPEPPVGLEVRQALYRIAQEAVQNAAKHARAGQVTLRLFTRGTDVVLEVVDDGAGFTPDADFPGRLGVRSMRERAQAAGGRLDIASAPSSGTTVRATLPLRPEG